MKRAVIYTRVSTDKQNTENQIIELKEIALRSNYQIVQIYEDKGISGSKSKDERIALKQLMNDACKRKFDIVLVWSIDRLGRSLKHLVELMNELDSYKIDMFFLQQSIDTQTSTGKMIFGIFSSLAEYERNLIRERVISGLNRVKLNGKKLGRKTIINDNIKKTIIVLREKGLSVREICKTVGLSIGSYYNCLE